MVIGKEREGKKILNVVEQKRVRIFGQRAMFSLRNFCLKGDILEKAGGYKHVNNNSKKESKSHLNHPGFFRRRQMIQCDLQLGMRV